MIWLLLVFFNVIPIFSLISTKFPSLKCNINILKQATNNVVITVDQYDIKRIQFQTKLGLDLSDPRFTQDYNSGKDLRRNRKNENSYQANKKTKLIKNKLTSTNNKLIQTPIKRFILGNGIEGLTPSSLISLVHSTTPYLFESESERLIIDEDLIDATASHHGGEEYADLENIIQSNTVPKLKSRDNNQHIHEWERIFSYISNFTDSEKATEDDRLLYFKLCIASHFSTVASYVPTDVDSKIRGHCWFVLYSVLCIQHTLYKYTLHACMLASAHICIYTV